MKKRYKYISLFIILILLFLSMLLLSLVIGNASISLSDIFPVISGDKSSRDYMILVKIRLPRVIMAAILGGALSISGYLLQTFFENPIAGPFVLGISSGSKLMVALCLIISLKYFPGISSLSLIGASFTGAIISTLFLLLIARRVKDNASLLVAGIMTGYIASACTEFILNFADDSNIVNLHGWSLGSFSGTEWRDVRIAFIIAAAALILTFIFAKPIGAFELGENYARSMGVNVLFFRVVIILLSSILSALVTAFAGPISFVGIAVPFLTKNMFNSSKTVLILPAIFLMGSVFVMVCDLIARSAFSPTELSISTVTGIIGAPIVVFMLLRRREG